jgi:hypothetical protein
MHSRNSTEGTFPKITRMAVVHVLPSHVDWCEQSPSIGLGFLHDSYSTRAAAAWVGFLLITEKTSSESEHFSSSLTRACRRVAVL